MDRVAFSRLTKSTNNFFRVKERHLQFFGVKSQPKTVKPYLSREVTKILLIHSLPIHEDYSS